MSQSSGFQKNADKIVLILILLMGLILRIMSLQGEAFWEDEAQSFYQARNPFFISTDNPFGIQSLQDRFVFLHYILENDIHPPLYYAQLGLWSLLGLSDWFLRGNSIVWGVLTIIAVYYLAHKLAISPAVPAIAASLVAFSPFHVEMSIELRMYSLIAFLSVLSIIYLQKLLQQSQAKLQDWLIFTCVNLCIIYAQGIGLIWLLLLNLIYLGLAVDHWFRPKQLPTPLKAWIFSQLITEIAFLPWIGLKLRGGASSFTSVAKYLRAPTFIELLEAPRNFLFNNAASPSFPSPLLTTPNWILALLAGLAVGLIATAVIALRKNVATLFLLGMPSIGGLLVVELISVAIRPIFIIRALIFCMPFFAILVAIGLVQIGWFVDRWRSSQRSPQAQIFTGTQLVSLVLVGAMGINLWGIYQGVTTPNRKQWQEAGAIVAQQIQPMDTIVIPRSTMGSFMLYSPPIQRENYTGLLMQKLRSYWMNGQAAQATKPGYQDFLKSYGLDYGKNVSWIIVTSAVEPNLLLKNGQLNSHLWMIDSLNKGGKQMDDLISLVSQNKPRQTEQNFYQVSVASYQ